MSTKSYCQIAGHVSMELHLAVGKQPQTVKPPTSMSITAQLENLALSWCCTHQLLNTLFEIYLV